MDYYKLQNGSDIRGVAIAGVEHQPITLTPKAAADFAIGFAQFLSQQTNQPLKIAIGHDSRLSADSLKAAMIAALIKHGVDVIDCGLASTPAMFMSTLFEEFNCDGAMIITASHLPYNRNGIKFFNRQGGLNKADITKIIDYACHVVEGTKQGSSTQQDLISRYALHLQTMMKEQINHPTNYDQPLTGMKIVVDAGNGAGGFYATKVLQELGADIDGSQFLEPDGTFPNHIPNPENEEAMASICQAVKKHRADLGLIFDTDVDRSSAVDRHGNEISRNAIIALSAALLVDEHPHTTIVTDSVTSDELADFLIHHLQLQHHRYMRGYKNVINEAIRLNQAGIDAQLAIETSGHAAFKENYFLDDGAYLATKIVIKAAKMFLEHSYIDELINDLKHPLETKELRFTMKAENFSEYGDLILAKLSTIPMSQPEFIVVPNNYEGLRFCFDEAHGNGWFLLRKSLHDPVLALNIESNTPQGCIMIAKQVYQVVKDFSDLDCQEIIDFIHTK